MDYPEDQGTQMPEEFFNDCIEIHSSPQDEQALLEPNDDEEEDYTDCEDGTQDIEKSAVEETQFDDLEPGTQANQDILGSHVPETQFAGLEPDTQGMDQSVVAPQPPRGIATNPPQPDQLPLLRRPELVSITDVGKDFKFGPANLRANNTSQRLPKLSNLMAANTSRSTHISAQHADASCTTPPYPETTQLSLPSVQDLDPSTTLSNSRHEFAPARQSTTIGSDERPAEAAATQDTAHISRSAHHTPGNLPDHSSTKKTSVEFLAADTQNTCDKLLLVQHDPNHHLKPNVALASTNTTVRTEAIQESPRESTSTRHNAAYIHNWPISKDSNMGHYGLGFHLPPISPEEDSSIPHQPQTRVTSKVPLNASHGPVRGSKEAQTGPLTPLKSAENARPVQRNLSRGRQRIKQPFPEAAAPEKSRRWHDKTLVNSVNAAQQNDADATRTRVQLNTGNTRSPTRDDTKTDIKTRRRQPSPSLPDGYTEISRQAGTRIITDLHAAADEPQKVADPFTLQVKALRENENINGAGHTIDKLNVHSAALTSEHQSNDNVHSLNPQNQCLPATSNESIEHEDANMQRNLGSNQLYEEVGYDATDGREQNIHVAHHQTLAQGDVLGSAKQHPVQPPSGAIPEAQSRPRSRRSELPKPISRPVSSHDLKSADSVIPNSSHATKVKKSNKSNKQNVPVDRIKSPEQRLPTPIRLMMELQRQSGNGIVENYMHREILIKSQQAQLEEQVARIKSQEVEIATQGNRFTSRGTELAQLKVQYEELQKKNNIVCEKLKQQCIKYVEHANDLVRSQKGLKDLGAKLLQTSTDTLKIYTKREANEEKFERATEKLENALKKSKEFRLAAEKHETVLKENEVLMNKNNELEAEKVSYNAKLETIESQLKEAESRRLSDKASLQAKNDELVTQNDTLKLEVEKAIKNCELVQMTLNDRLNDLGTERHNTEQLQNNLNEQKKTWGQLFELVKQIPKDTAEVLNGDDSAISKMLSSDITTQEKIVEMASMIKELTKHEPELPPTLAKLVEDVALKLEGEKQLSDSNSVTIRDATATITQELKDGLNQLRLDKQEEIRLNNKITELEQARESLNAHQLARDTEVENLSRQLEESKRELSNCRGDLNNKNTELTIALNTPREDPELRTKISELENAKNVLDGQVKEANQEVLKIKEELSATRKIAASKEEENKTLAQTLGIARQTIQKFDEDKANALALKDEEHKKTCQEIARNGESQKATVKMKLNSEIKTLEVRITERNTEIRSLKEQLQSLQTDAQNHNMDLEAELSANKEQMGQLIAQLKRLEQDNGSNQHSSEFWNEMTSVRDEIAELSRLFQSGTSDTAQTMKVATREQKAIEEALRRVDESQKQEEVTREQRTTSQHFVHSGANDRDSSRLPGHKHAGSHARQTELEDDMLLDNGLAHTPENALRSATRRAGSTSGPSRFGGITEPVAGEVNGTESFKALVTVLPRGHVERLAHSRAAPHTVVQQRQGLDSPGLRAAPRMSDRVEASAPSVTTPSQPPRSGIVTPQAIGKGNDSAFYKDFADSTPVGPSNSPKVPIKAQLNAPSKIEESRRRRTSQPAKSALKKSTRSNSILQEQVTVEGQVDTARHNSSKNEKSMRSTQSNDRPLDNIKGLVSGKVTRSLRSVGNHTPLQGTPGSSSSSIFDLQQSPPMGTPTQNSGKRVASTVLHSSKLKAPRLGFRGNLSSQTVIPDSQAETQNTVYG